MTLHSLSFYARTLRATLPQEVFAPVPARLFWLALHLSLIVVGLALLAAAGGGWPIRLALAVLIGHSFAGIAFVGHELLHGAIVRSRVLRHLLGWLCLLPFMTSPRLWVAWHNRVHHGNTMRPGVDPDAYPTLQAYERSRLLQLADYLAPARGRSMGWFSLILGFTLQSLQVLLCHGRAPGYLGPRQYAAAVLETLLGLAVWTALGFYLGPETFVYAYLIPLLVANAVVMGYILTNHNLSPLTEANDPLLNTLTVTTPRLFSRLHLNFGLHVEHHLFPAMSAVHADTVRAELIRRWPERYKSMPLHRALILLFTTPRIYKDATTLIDPHTGHEHQTLLPDRA